MLHLYRPGFPPPGGELFINEIPLKADGVDGAVYLAVVTAVVLVVLLTIRSAHAKLRTRL